MREASWIAISRDVVFVTMIVVTGYVAIDSVWSWTVETLCRELLRCR